MDLTIKNMEISCKAKGSVEKNTLKSLGFQYSKTTKDYRVPANYKTLTEIKNSKASVKIVSDDGSLDKVKLSFRRDKFLTRYLESLLSGKRKPKVTGHVFKEGVTPMEHQKIALDFVRLTDDLALFWDCGLGKTFVACHWASYLNEKIKNFKALVIAPKATLHPTWVGDLTKFTCLNSVVLDKGSSSNKKTLTKTWKRKSLNRDFTVYLINFDSVGPILEDLKAQNFELLIIDESTFIKNPMAKLSNAIVELADTIPRTSVMAGLPTPNKSYDLFMQMRAMGPQYLGPSYYKFMNENYYSVMLPSSSSGVQRFFPKWYEQPHCTKTLQAAMKKKGLRLTMQDSGVELPGKVSIVRQISLSKDLYTRYKNLVDDCIIYLQGTPLLSEGISKIMRLREVTSGFVMDEEGNACTLDGVSKKAKCIAELLYEEIGKDDEGDLYQAIIWAHFKKEYQDLKEVLGSDVRVLAEAKKGSEVIADFKNKKFAYLVANPASMGHGVTLVQCNYMVWYSFSYSSEQYYQANRRIARVGQTKTAIIIHLEAVGPAGEKTVDKLLMDSVEGKIKDNNSLLSAFREEFGS